MNQIKLKRLEAELVKTIGEILLEESNDEFMKSVTITGSEISADLSFAKVYFTSMQEDEHRKLEQEMNEASDFVRKFVAEKMDMRQTPKLRFVYDESIAYGNRIEQILEEIKNDSSEMDDNII